MASMLTAVCFIFTSLVIKLSSLKLILNELYIFPNSSRENPKPKPMGTLFLKTYTENDDNLLSARSPNEIVNNEFPFDKDKFARENLLEDSNKINLNQIIEKKEILNIPIEGLANLSNIKVDELFCVREFFPNRCK